jgi:hypothetical protein
MARARTIIEEDDVAALIDQAAKSYPRIEEVWDAWKWRLARDPFRDATLLRDNLYLIRTVPELTSYGLPSGITILYEPNDNEVHIKHIRIIEDK